MDFDPIHVHDWLRRSAARSPDKVAVICEEERWTYSQIDRCSDRLARTLISLGLCRQDRVAIVAGNRPETVVGLYGTLKAGGVFVILEGNTRARRLRFVLENSGARLLVARASQAAMIREVLADLPHDLTVIWLDAQESSHQLDDICGLTWNAACSDGWVGDSSAAVEFPCGVDLDLAALIYTSATTGQPKGVMCTHQNMISAARSISQYLGNEESDIILDVLPLSFGYGLYQVLTSCMFGGTVVLERSFLYPHVVLSRITQEKVTAFPLVPSMAAMILRMDKISEYDFSSLRYMTSAGAALPTQHYRRLRHLVPQARIFNMYGLTECVRVCYLAGKELDDAPASVGRPMPNCEVRIVDEQTNDVPTGQVGELIIRGANVMQGYWGDSEMTARTFRSYEYPACRWLHSGDYFKMGHDGLLYFLGRRDDMIKTMGERVSPREIEDVICELDGVNEAAAIGVPDDILGQAIKIFVVANSLLLTDKDILRHCSRRLEPLMMPKHIEFIDALPKTDRGKVNRRELQVVRGE